MVKNAGISKHKICCKTNVGDRLQKRLSFKAKKNNIIIRMIKLIERGIDVQWITGGALGR